MSLTSWLQPKVKVEAGYAPPPNSGLGESSRQRDRGRDRDRDRDHHHHHYQAQDHDNDSDGNCVHADGEHDDDSDIEVFDIKDGEYQPSESRQSLKSLFEKWPKGEAKAAILRELQSEESESLWESWVTKYPSGKIDPTDLRDFLLPHRALHRIVGFHYPTSPIDEIYRPHLTNIRKAAIWLFRELAYGSWTLYVRRLTRALRSLSVAPTLVQPPCSACHKRDIPCLEGQKQHCFHCLLANITVCLRSTPAQAAARSQPPSGGRSKPCTYIYGSAKVCPTKKRPRFSNRNDNQARGNTKRRDADMRETRDTAAQAPRDSVLYLLDATPETFNHDPHSTRTTIRMNNVDRSPATGSNTVLHEGDAEGHTIVGGINVVDVRDRRLALEMLGTHLRHDPDDERKKYGEYIFSCLQKIIDSGGEELDRVLLELHYHATEDEPDEKRRRKALFILTQLEKEVAKVIRGEPIVYMASLLTLSTRREGPSHSRAHAHRVLLGRSQGQEARHRNRARD